MLFMALIVATALSFAIAFLLMPQPKVKPLPARPARPVAPRVEQEPALPFDPSAFWLYPDWDGPIDEPFWMRPIKAPAQNVATTRFSGPSVPYRVFLRDAAGETVTITHLA